MPRENQEKLSCLWLKETKNGQKFFAGTNDGFSYVIFKNGFKEKDSQPDYILYREPVEEQQNVRSQYEPNTNELPF